jgi:predicted  nucleic acid-binding Zn-ribbon protein
MPAAHDLQIGPTEPKDDDDKVAPIAEQIFQRKKLQGIEDGIMGLKKDSRLQQECVLKIEVDMRTMITEADLRRAIGLAFQEFEVRLQDAFQESNRKFLNMFSKKEDVASVEGMISKKVNWSEYHHVLSKISELRSYIDTTAESVFIGHRDALHQEFARKADAATVDMALKSKADFTEMNDLRARLERLEMLFSHAGMHHSAMLEDLRTELTDKFNGQIKQLQVHIKDHTEEIDRLKEQQKLTVDRVASNEAQIAQLNSVTDTLKERQAKLWSNQHNILDDCKSIHEQLTSLDEGQKNQKKDLTSLNGDLKDLNASCEVKFSEISEHTRVHSQQIEFLMQASEATKRRMRELSKKLEASCQGLTEENEHLTEHLSALERTMKRQEQTVKAMDHRAQVGGIKQIRTAEPPVDPNVHLHGVLSQLSAIALDPREAPSLKNAAGVDLETTSKLPLPWMSGEEGSLPRLPAGTAPDSARSGNLSAGTKIGGMHGLSPRTIAGAKPAKKKDKDREKEKK